MIQTLASEVARPSVLQVIGVGVAAVVMMVFAAGAFMANCDPNRNRFRYRHETRNPARPEGSPGRASSVNGDWRRRPNDSGSSSQRVPR